MKRFTGLVLALIVLAAGVGRAHHSFAATYDDKKLMEIEGSIVLVTFRNPHSFVAIEDKDGVRWNFEWAAGQQLAVGGVSRDTLKVGDHVMIKANPGREVAEDHRCLLKIVRRTSDGWTWGMNPDEVVK
jgi:hypothetical protein